MGETAVIKSNLDCRLARRESAATMTTQPEQQPRQEGYTLVELLVVLAILGLLVAIAAPRLISYLGAAKADTAKIQVEKLAGVLDLYHLDVGSYPTDRDGLAALMERPPQAAV